MGFFVLGVNLLKSNRKFYISFAILTFLFIFATLNRESIFMILRKTNRKFILVLLAYSIAWFSLYSIINFHQYRIFGKELFHNTNLSLLKKEDDIFNAQFKLKQTNEFDPVVKLRIFNLISSNCEFSLIFHFYSKQLNSISGFCCRRINCNSQNSLRAPPLVS